MSSKICSLHQVLQAIVDNHTCTSSTANRTATGLVVPFVQHPSPTMNMDKKQKQDQSGTVSTSCIHTDRMDSTTNVANAAAADDDDDDDNYDDVSVQNDATGWEPNCDNESGTVAIEESGEQRSVGTKSRFVGEQHETNSSSKKMRKSSTNDSDSGSCTSSSGSSGKTPMTPSKLAIKIYGAITEFWKREFRKEPPIVPNKGNIKISKESETLYAVTSLSNYVSYDKFMENEAQYQKELKNTFGDILARTIIVTNTTSVQIHLELNQKRKNEYLKSVLE